MIVGQFQRLWFMFYLFACVILFCTIFGYVLCFWIYLLMCLCMLEKLLCLIEFIDLVWLPLMGVTLWLISCCWIWWISRWFLVWINWLSPYYAILICHAMILTLAISKMPMLEWRGSLDHSKSRVIYFWRFNVWLRRGI